MILITDENDTPIGKITNQIDSNNATAEKYFRTTRK